jgi:diguanylate cyclase
MSCVVEESRLLRSYAAGQVLSIVAFFFIPIEGWLHALWQVGVGWAGATFVLVGMRRFRPEGTLAWYALSAGVFLNAGGLLVEMIGVRFFHITSAPGPADLFWLSLFPGLIIALGTMVYRRSACEDLAALALNTIVCALVATALAIVAWEFIVWQTHTDPHLSLSKRMIVTAYPLGDLIVLALLLRLVFAGGARNAAFALIVLALAFFLGADIGWAGLLRAGKTPGPMLRRLLEMASMGAFALVGAAALHPAVRRIATSDEMPRPDTARARWVALMVSILTAPVVLLAQALLDHWSAVSSF